MRFTRTALAGVTLVESDAHRDNRGTFRRLWCSREAAAAGLPGQIVQTSLSVTRHRHTLRGMHFQLPPSREDKLVRCVAGRIYDVALDLRPHSSTYMRYVSAELSSDAGNALFIPAGCAHGFLTLAEDCAVLYMMSDYYDAALSTGVRWDDPAFDIDWPARPADMLERDASYPDFDPGTVDGFADFSMVDRDDV